MDLRIITMSCSLTFACMCIPVLEDCSPSSKTISTEKHHAKLIGGNYFSCSRPVPGVWWYGEHKVNCSCKRPSQQCVCAPGAGHCSDQNNYRCIPVVFKSVGVHSFSKESQDTTVGYTLEPVRYHHCLIPLLVVK